MDAEWNSENSSAAGKTRRTKPNLRIIGRKTAGIGRRRLREAATADGRRERVPWLPAPGMKAKRGR
jgi:hypothetical protein